MPQRRRVAIAIDLTYPLQHHHGVFAGIQKFAHERASWQTFVQMRMPTLRSGRDKFSYHGIIARAGARLAKEALAARVPLVTVWSGTSVKDCASVLPDFAAIGTQAAEHLLMRGFRRFAFHGFRGHKGSELALAAFKAVLRAKKCPVNSLIVSPDADENDRTWDRYQARLQRWITGWQRPLGALVMHDNYCRYVADACRMAGFRVPEETALIGTGNELLVCSQPEPSLSSFDLNYERVGYEAAALLDRLMDGAVLPNAPKWIEPKELVLRHSTETYVVDDPLVAAALRFIAEHVYEGIRVDDVASRVHASVRTLELHFRSATGRTMVDEISRLRIERAKRLLVEGDSQIKDVSRDCGFASAKHFHRVFTRAEGLSPSEFRARRRTVGRR